MVFAHNEWSCYRSNCYEQRKELHMNYEASADAVEVVVVVEVVEVFSADYAAMNDAVSC